MKASIRRSPAPPFTPSNVVAMRQRVLPRHKALLARWVQAGERMGLHNAQAFRPDGREQRHDYVLVWVRENPDPAYMVEPEGMRWVVTDMLRELVLARFPDFGQALNFIRPVLAIDAAA